MDNRNNIKIFWENTPDDSASQRLSQVFDMIFDKVQELEDKKTREKPDKVCSIINLSNDRAEKIGR